MAKKGKKKVAKGNSHDGITLANKKRRLERHLKKHPNDEQSRKGFKGTRRKKPLHPGSRKHTRV